MNAASNGAYKSPDERMAPIFDVNPSDYRHVASQSGKANVDGEVFLTGICFQSSGASEYVRNGINPVTGTQIENYQEFVEEYLKHGPDSATVVTDQFTPIADGDIVVVIEDQEWGEHIADQLTQAEIPNDESRVREDVRQAYRTHQEMFRNYTDLCGSDMEIHFFLTSEYQDVIKEGMDEAPVSSIDPENPEDRTYFMQSRYFPGLVANEFGFDDQVHRMDPARHCLELLNPSQADHPLEKAKKKHYRAGNDRETQLFFTFQALAPFGHGRQKEIEADPNGSTNLDTYEDVLEEMSRETPENLATSPAVRLATMFPHRVQSIERLLEAKEALQEGRDARNRAAREFVANQRGVEPENLYQKFDGSDIGPEIGERAEQLRQQTLRELGDGENVYDSLVRKLEEDLNALFNT